MAIGRWGQAYKARPQYLERLLKVLAACSLALYPDIVPFVLEIAGTDYERIQRHASVLMVAWAKLLLDRGNLTDVNRAKLLGLVDNLARLGDTDALELQRDLER
jgi:hypothetical protein